MRTSSVLTIAIVTYNSADVIGGLLDSLWEALDPVPAYRIVVVDNQSSDASLLTAASHRLLPEVLPMPGNAGYAAAINAAVLHLPVDGPLLVLNPDLRLAPAAIGAMLARLQDERIGAVAPCMMSDDGTLALSIRREPSILRAWAEALLGGKLARYAGLSELVGRSAIYQNGGTIEWATGAALLISQRARQLVGAWDDRYFLYSEEVDYLRRIREAGLQIAYAPEAICTHRGGESNVDPHLFALLTANRIRYFERYHGRLATRLFRYAVLCGEALRYSSGPTHRAALKAVWEKTGRPADILTGS